MTALIVTIAGVSYLAIGAVYARSRVADCWTRAKAEWEFESIARDSLVWMLAWRGLVWPLAMMFDTARGPVAAWFTAPLRPAPKPAPETDREKYERMAREQETLAYTARQQGLDELAAMQTSLAKQYREMARIYQDEGHSRRSG